MSQENKIVGTSDKFTTQWAYNAADRVVSMSYPMKDLGHSKGSRIKTHLPGGGGRLQEGGLDCQAGSYFPKRWRKASVSGGRMANRSPTTPKRESLKIGASASLLIATITLLLRIPAWCWMAPEMPQAM
jgi:hypothetical protein